MGDTGANMSPWGGLYMGGGAPATTVVTTGAVAAAGGSVSSPTSGGSGGGSPTRTQQQAGAVGVEGGRVGKSARRRSRASRRAPVTLLNTDTSNFRAMVQQFTGIPAGPYGPGGGAGGGPVISFGAGSGAGEYGGLQLVRPSPTSAVMSFDHQLAAAAHAQHRPTATSLQSQLFRPQQHHQQQYGGDVGYGMHAGVGGGDGMAPSFLHGGFDSSSAEDRLLLQSMMKAAQTTMPTGRPASTNNGNGYNFG